MKIKGSKLRKNCCMMLLATMAVLAALLFADIKTYAIEMRIGTLTASGVNFRKGAGTSYASLGALEKDTWGVIIGEAKDSKDAVWYKMIIAEREGWVHSSYVKVKNRDVDFEEYMTLQGFPESYKDSLRELHELYPNWVFEAQHTNLEWDTVIEEESKLGKNLTHNSSISSWKSTQTGAYSWTTSTWKELDSGNWVAASEKIIKYYMDPRNFLDATYIFQFIKQSYDASSMTDAEIALVKEGLAAMVEGTYLAGKCGSKTYVNVLMETAAEKGVSPYTLASMLIQEQGIDGSGSSISGKVKGYEGYYNYFNVGAYATSSLTAVQKGLQYAMAEGSYGRPWNTRVKSIKGGAEYFAEGYVKVGQDTMYLKKFNVQGSNLYSHQYMTNVGGAASEGYHMAAAYDENARNAALVFRIPIYTNMPETPCEKPTGDGSPNNMLKTLKVANQNLTPTFNMYETSYSLIVDYDVESIKITAKAYDEEAKVSGTGTKALEVGTNKLKVTVKAGNGDKRVYTISVIRQKETEGSTVAVGALKSSKYTVDNENCLVTGIAALPVKADAFAEAFSAKNGTIKLTDAEGNEKTKEVGTGDLINVYNSKSKLQTTHTVLIYGDTNGDGKINALDLLRVQKNILKLAELEGIYATAADTSKDGKINVLDLLQVQKQILKVKEIEQ